MNVVMLSVVLTNVVMLIVMAPFVTSARLFLLGQLLRLAHSKWLRTRLECLMFQNFTKCNLNFFSCKLECLKRRTFVPSIFFTSQARAYPSGVTVRALF